MKRFRGLLVVRRMTVRKLAKYRCGRLWMPPSVPPRETRWSSISIAAGWLQLK
jgi:hypothetical protein